METIARSADGVLKLPKAMRRDLIVLLTCKAVALTLIYLAFFSPSHHPLIDVAARIAGNGLGP